MTKSYFVNLKKKRSYKNMVTWLTGPFNSVQGPLLKIRFAH